MAGLVRRALGAVVRALSCPPLNRAGTPRREASDLIGWTFTAAQCRTCGAPFLHVGPDTWQCATVAGRTDDEASRHGWVGPMLRERVWRHAVIGRG